MAGTAETSAEGDASWRMKPISFFRSMYTEKNGTPRQSGLCPQALGSFTIAKDVFNNPEHSLDGLREFSHLWLVLS